MGSYVEINDTLQLTIEQGFPADILDREKHTNDPVKIVAVGGKLFEFKGKPSARIFHLDPVRVFLVHNIKGKWLFWGHAFIQSQTIEKKLDDQGQWKEGEWITSGTYTIVNIYDPEFQKTFTMHESPPGKSYFDE